MTQDVVRRRYKEEEIRQCEMLQIVVAFHLPVVAAVRPGDHLALRAVDLCANQGLHEAQGGFDAALGSAATPQESHVTFLRVVPFARIRGFLPAFISFNFMHTTVSQVMSKALPSASSSWCFILL
jgi:hypothetical protein